jgi:hypothetical protein
VGSVKRPGYGRVRCCSAHGNRKPELEAGTFRRGRDPGACWPAIGLRFPAPLLETEQHTASPAFVEDQHYRLAVFVVLQTVMRVAEYGPSLGQQNQALNDVCCGAVPASVLGGGVAGAPAQGDDTADARWRGGVQCE